MSKLEELIQQYCPDGVEYKPIGDYLKYEQPTKYLVESTKYDDSYPTPVLTAGQSFILGYTKETDGIYKASKDSPVIIFDDFTTSLHWVEFSFKVKSSAMKMLTPVDETKALFRYLYYCMKNIMYVPGDHTRQWIGTYSQFEIPIPPLPVQEEIVRVLDTFTELQAELQAELQKRLQQYNYYRDNLLSFDGRTDVEWKKLGEISKVCRGVRVVKSQLSNEGYPVYQNCLTPMGYYDKTNCPAGTPFVICGGAAGNVGYADVDWWAADDCEYIIGNVGLTNRYIYHCLMAKKDYLLSQVRKASIPRLSPSVIKDLEIPVPSLAEQQRIVDILDMFDSLTTDLTAGLPAEIEKRKLQYEYYRDKLLTFKRK